MRVRRLLLLPMVLALGAAGVVGGVVAGRSVAEAVVAPGAIDTSVNPAAASWAADRFDLFARSADGSLRHKVYNGRWSAWETLGGTITSGPAAVSSTPGRIDVIARSNSGAVTLRTFKAGVWGAWSSLGGTTVGTPAISSRGPNKLDVFARWTDNSVRHRAFDGTNWTGWATLGGTVNSAPASVSWASDRIDVVVRGGGNALYHKWWTASNSWVSTWERLDGNLASNPTIVTGGSGFLSIFARNPSNVITTKGFGFGSWTNWSSPIPGTVANAPAAVATSGSRTDLFSFGPTGALLQTTWIGFVGWSPWQPVPESGPAIAPAAFALTTALQLRPVAPATVGGLAYAYVDNIGRVVVGQQSDPDNFFSLQWTVISGNEAFTGPPGLIQPPDGKLQLSAEHTSGDVWATAQTAVGAPTWTEWLSRGGQLGASAVQVVNQIDNTTLVLALDPAGGLWSLPQPSLTGGYRTWTSLGITGLTALPAAVAVQDGLRLFGVTASGAVQTATLAPSGTVSAWTTLGGSVLSGTPAAVVVPGYRVRVFVRTGDGTLVTKMQAPDLTWPAEWTPVGGLVGAGSPAAVLSPLSGRIEVVSRGTDDNMWTTGETAQGSGVWRTWVQQTVDADAGTVRTSPTILSYSSGGGLRWAFLFRNADQQTRLYVTDSSGAAALSGRSSASVTDAPVTVGDVPTFVTQTLPAPPH